MYNGIGLATARGSGTNGYVQRNLAFIKPNKEKITLTEEELNRINEIALLPKKMHSSIIEHERKRKIEIKCLEMRELMEDQGYEADEIEEKVKSFRQMLLTKDKTKQQELINGPKFINEKNDKAERFRQVFLPDKDVKANDSDELSSHEAQDRRKGSPQDRSTRPHP